MADDDEALPWPVDTAEFIHFDVTAPDDPLADDVFVALVPRGTARAAEHFIAAEWVPGQTWVDEDTPVRVRRFLPAFTLENRQTYKAVVRITDDPETPVIPAGSVRGTL